MQNRLNRSERVDLADLRGFYFAPHPERDRSWFYAFNIGFCPYCNVTVQRDLVHVRGINAGVMMLHGLKKWKGQIPAIIETDAVAGFPGTDGCSTCHGQVAKGPPAGLPTAAPGSPAEAMRYALVVLKESAKMHRSAGDGPGHGTACDRAAHMLDRALASLRVN